MSLDMSDPKTHEMFLRWTKGNQDAARLLVQFCQLAREIDDLVDEHYDIQDRITSIVELSLVHVASNPFFMRFNAALSAVVFEMLTYWRLGDQWRRSNNEKQQMFGFVYRESTDRLAVVIAGLVGGSDHAKSVAEELYHATHFQSPETFQDWIAPDEVPDGPVLATERSGS